MKQFVLAFGLWFSCLGLAQGIFGQPPSFQLTNPLVGQPVRQLVDFIPPHWLGSLSVAEDANGNLNTFFYAVPPPPGPRYRFRLENLASPLGPAEAVDGAFANLHGMFGNLGGYFGRLSPIRPSPEDMEDRREEFKDFEKHPWKYPQFLHVYWHIPSEIARKLLEHQRKELTDNLFRVLDDKMVRETERFAAGNELFIRCLTDEPWPAQTLITHWLLHVDGDRLFSDATIDGKEVDIPVVTAEDYHSYLRRADKALEDHMAVREKRCEEAARDWTNDEVNQAPVDRASFLVWAAEEKALWAFDNWLSSSWRRIDPDGYQKDPTYSPRSEKFVELIERLNFEISVYDYLKRELAKFSRSEDEPERVFPPTLAQPGGFIAYLNENFSHLVRQSREVLLLEYLAPVRELLSRNLESWKHDQNAREEEWVKIQIAASPEKAQSLADRGSEMLSDTILKRERWRSDVLDYLRHYPGKQSEALKTLSALEGHD